METIAGIVRRERKQLNEGSPRAGKSPRKAIDQAINRLEGHWVHDVAELFADCSEAVSKLEAVLRQLKQQSGESVKKNAELGPKIRELAIFLKRWEALADKQLTEQIVCPHEVEFHLESIKKCRKRATRS
jgi:hypothetical protein